MISQSTIEQVRERASLLEIVGETVTLKRQGGGFVGLCPFHGEKTPSFHVKGDDGYYHCFGCGVSGNVITFVMETRGLSFRDAVESLAQRYSIEVKYEGGKAQGPADDRDSKQQLTRINKLAAKFFSHQLERAPAVVHQYVRERGITPEAREFFSLGFAPNERSALLEFLRGQGIPDPLILRSGLVRRSQSGDLYDAFRGRLIFPVVVEGNRVAGFGGRLLPQVVDDRAREQAPKYINSPETPLYEKSKILYGLAPALQDIRVASEVIIVEGYVDVIGLWQVGIRQVVAPCGTALTGNHVKRLKHLVTRVSILFDGDAAGRSAAAKAFTVFINSGLEVVARFLPEGEDPDTLALKHGEQTAAVLRELPAAPLWDCFISSILQRYGAADGPSLGAALKGRVARELMDTLATVSNSVERHELAEHAAMRLGIPATEITAVRPAGLTTNQGRRAADPASASTTPPAAAEQRDLTDFQVLSKLEQETLLCIMALKERGLQELAEPKGLLNDCNLLMVRFVDELRAALESSPSIDERKRRVKELLRTLGVGWEEQWRRAHQLLESPDVSFERHLRDCKNMLLRLRFQRLRETLARDLRGLPDGPERDKLRQDELQLIRKERELQER